MSNITIELSKEDRKALEALTGAVTLLASVLGSMQPPAVQQQIVQEATGPKMTQAEDGTVKLVKPELPVEGTAHLEPAAAEPAPEAKPVSFAEFQKAVTQAVAKGPTQKAAAKKIINEYAESVSAVPEDKRAEVMDRLAKI